MGKSTISMAMFNSFLYVYQRVSSTIQQFLAVSKLPGWTGPSKEARSCGVLCHFWARKSDLAKWLEPWACRCFPGSHHGVWQVSYRKATSGSLKYSHLRIWCSQFPSGQNFQVGEIGPFWAEFCQIYWFYHSLIIIFHTNFWTKRRDGETSTRFFGFDGTMAGLFPPTKMDVLRGNWAINGGCSMMFMFFFPASHVWWPQGLSWFSFYPIS